MRPMLKRLSAACAGALLLACAGPAQRAPGAAAAGAQARAAGEAYASARRHHLAGRRDEAARSYQEALAADPGDVNARNGLATLYAEQDDLARAIPIWERLAEGAAATPGPGTAYLFSNLGYAYLLNGEFDKAIVALEKACLRDPLNHRAWLHLGHALHKLGQDERARQMFSQANALQEHDFRSDYATAGGGAGVRAIDAAVRAPARHEPEWAASDVVVGNNGMLELRRVPAGQAAPAPAQVLAGRQPPALPPATEPPAPGVALLEIRNGNGVTGMAKALSRQVGEPGLKVVRLTNEKGFAVRQTRVEYRAAFRAAAERLAERFGGTQAVQVDALPAADVRLVIGRDLARGKLALRPPAGEPKLADVAKPDKTG